MKRHSALQPRSDDHRLRFASHRGCTRQSVDAGAAWNLGVLEGV